MKRFAITRTAMTILLAANTVIMTRLVLNG